MKLYQMEIYRLKDGRVLLAHFPNRKQALGHIEKKFDGWRVGNVIEITQPAYFQVADQDPDESAHR